MMEDVRVWESPARKMVEKSRKDWVEPWGTSVLKGQVKSSPWRRREENA